MKLRILAIPFVTILSACSATTTFQSVNSNTVLTIDKTESIALTEPSTHTYSTTSFGQYVFKASDEGEDPMYGLIPLKFNGGYLALDILFFAPATFFNLREVYPFYEFDVKSGVVRYKKEPEDAWRTYTATEDEVNRAKAYFSNPAE